MPAPGDEHPPTVEDIQFEPAQLEASAAAGRGEIWLLSWLSKCEKAVKVLPEVRASSHTVSSLYCRPVTSGGAMRRGKAAHG